RERGQTPITCAGPPREGGGKPYNPRPTRGGEPHEQARMRRRPAGGSAVCSRANLEGPRREPALPVEVGRGRRARVDEPPEARGGAERREAHQVGRDHRAPPRARPPDGLFPPPGLPPAPQPP